MPWNRKAPPLPIELGPAACNTRSATNGHRTASAAVAPDLRPSAFCGLGTDAFPNQLCSALQASPRLASKISHEAMRREPPLSATCSFRSILGNFRHTPRMRSLPNIATLLNHNWQPRHGFSCFSKRPQFSQHAASMQPLHSLTLALLSLFRVSPNTGNAYRLHLAQDLQECAHRT